MCRAYVRESTFKLPTVRATKKKRRRKKFFFCCCRDVVGLFKLCHPDIPLLTFLFLSSLSLSSLSSLSLSLSLSLSHSLLASSSSSHHLLLLLLLLLSSFKSCQHDSSTWSIGRKCSCTHLISNCLCTRISSSSFKTCPS